MKTIKIRKNWHSELYNECYKFWNGVDWAPSRIGLLSYCLYVARGVMLTPIIFVLWAGGLALDWLKLKWGGICPTVEVDSGMADEK